MKKMKNSKIFTIVKCTFDGVRSFCFVSMSNAKQTSTIFDSWIASQLNVSATTFSTNNTSMHI